MQNHNAIAAVNSSHIGGALAGAQVNPPKETLSELTLQRLRSENEKLISVANRLVNFTDRMLGAVPQNAEKGEASNPHCIAAAIEREFHTHAVIMDALFGICNRIEQIG